MSRMRGDCGKCLKVNIKSVIVYVPYWAVGRSYFNAMGEQFWCGFGGYKDIYESRGLVCSVVDDDTGLLQGGPLYPWLTGTYLVAAGAPGDGWWSGPTQSTSALGRARTELDKYDLDSMDWNTHIRVTYTASDNYIVNPTSRTITRNEQLITRGIPTELAATSAFLGAASAVSPGDANGMRMIKMQVQAFGYAKSCTLISYSGPGCSSDTDVITKTGPCPGVGGETITLKTPDPGGSHRLFLCGCEDCPGDCTYPSGCY